MTEKIDTDTYLDPRLGRLLEFDERSREYPILEELPRQAIRPKSNTWRCYTTIDQKREGMCVGAAWCHELAAEPYEIPKLDYAAAYKVYKLAQTLDAWPGTNYSGTSVIAGVKAIQKLYKGKIKSYKWAFSIDEVIATLGYHGPIVLGINWYEKMYTPDKDNWIKLGGRKVGGHAILAVGVDIKDESILLHNSWGSRWGKLGKCKISWADLEALLKMQGEACVPVVRGP